MGGKVLICVLGIERTRLKGTVIAHQTITTEVVIVHPLAKISAILGHAIHQNGMVCPFPDTSANQFGVLVHQFYIIVHITGSITHCVGVFTKEYRVLKHMVLSAIFQLGNWEIHTGKDIRNILIFLPAGILIVNQAGAVFFSCPTNHFPMVGAVTALVAGGPHNDTGVVLVPLHHP